MAEQADERLKGLNASFKEALGKLTGSDELEAQGVRERTGAGVVPQARAPRKSSDKSGASAAKSSAKPRAARAGATAKAVRPAKKRSPRAEK